MLPFERFLREFDRHDRDPAASAQALRDFADRVSKLFVQGWIMVDCGSEIAGMGAAKTITQIAMEQCQEFQTIRYGTKVKVLWSGTSKEECQGSLKEIGQIVKDMLDRLHVDFGSNDLYMAFEAMDLSE